jgi:hypothetical protein
MPISIGRSAGPKPKFGARPATGALIAVVAGVAALAALGAIVVGLIALYLWLVMQASPFAALGMIGSGLLLVALMLLVLERFPKRLNRGFPCWREYDSSSVLGGGQHGWRSRIRRTCVDAWSKRLMAGLPYPTPPS